MNAPEHIVFFTPGFADGEADDVCTPYLQILFKALHAKPGITISVIAFQYPYRKDVYNWNGITIYGCGGNNKRLTGKLKTWRQAKAYFDQIHAANPVTRLHAFWIGECALIATKLGAKFELPVVITAMGQDVMKLPKYLRRRDRKNYKITAVSERHANLFQKQLGRNVDAVIPHGIDSKDRVETSAARDIDLLGVGALIKLKNYGEFLTVLATIIAQRGPIKACIVGSGPALSALEKKAAELNLDQYIEFAGQQSRAKTLQYMRRSKVLLHPSQYESFGFALVEALQQGTPVVSKAVGFAAESTHWKVCETTEQLANSVAHFLDHPTSGDPVILQTVQQTVDQYLALYGS